MERAKVGVGPLVDVGEHGFAHSLPSGPDLLGSELLESLEACNAFRFVLVELRASSPCERLFQTPMT